ncbi:type I toxin-antitoxin system Ibs family toxin [Salmonella enterica subsp. enterica serovar Enteritidis]|nr:type I toxin-antitoxin system Ibs family toxin [Salmonella enterica subsp. enterica serovar Enteritidis]
MMHQVIILIVLLLISFPA